MTFRCVLDISHGGSDPGAQANGLTEKDLTLDLGLRTAKACADIDDLRITYTRSLDVHMTLAERGEASKLCGADLVLCIHANATNDNGSKGAITFYWPGNEVGEEIAEEIACAMPAKLIAGSVHAATEEKWPRVRNCLEVHAATAVLVECGFLTNEADASYLKTSLGKANVVTALRAGILRAMELKQGV